MSGRERQDRPSEDAGRAGRCLGAGYAPAAPTLGPHVSALDFRPGPRKSGFIELSGIDRGFALRRRWEEASFLSQAAVTDACKRVGSKQQESFLSHLEAGSPKSWRRQDHIPSEGSGGPSCLFQLPAVPGRPWPSSACRHIGVITPSAFAWPLARVPLCPTFPLIRTPIGHWIWATLLQHALVLTNYLCNDPISK